MQQHPFVVKTDLVDVIFFSTKKHSLRLIPQSHFLGLLTNCGLRTISFDDFIRKIKTLFHVLLNEIFCRNAMNLKDFVGCWTCWRLERREAVPGMP